MKIGNKKVSEVMPHLKIIAKIYNFKLNTAKGFKSSRLILANLYNKELI